MLQNVAAHNASVPKRKRYQTYVCFVTLYVMWRSRFDTFMFFMLTLCAATLSNIHVLERLRCVHLRYVATPSSAHGAQINFGNLTPYLAYVINQ